MIVQDSEESCDQCGREGVNVDATTNIVVNDYYIDLCDEHVGELTRILLERKLTGGSHEQTSSKA